MLSTLPPQQLCRCPLYTQAAASDVYRPWLPWQWPWAGVHTGLLAVIQQQTEPGIQVAWESGELEGQCAQHHFWQIPAAHPEMRMGSWHPLLPTGVPSRASGQCQRGIQTLWGRRPAFSDHVHEQRLGELCRGRVRRFLGFICLIFWPTLLLSSLNWGYRHPCLAAISSRQVTAFTLKATTSLTRTKVYKQQLLQHNFKFKMRPADEGDKAGARHRGAGKGASHKTTCQPVLNTLLLGSRMYVRTVRGQAALANSKGRARPYNGQVCLSSPLSPGSAGKIGRDSTQKGGRHSTPEVTG